eukprot:CAMPEP_0204643352 /NCGR_PEP_ID=MMETSP0718-20130828/639_1 /ASSEMBLY_ACC=CAM_ASM_000674 /TAXON_ID=230516 /ORGANISM="Chaetoceros curvisetus" /LENGTH=338 /DNA_ID=CAMNT_0051664533 /DNA_START=45 /DNA_END=1058 /DNA_ORIENTATION=+
MFLVAVPPNATKTLEIKLPHGGLKADSRVIDHNCMDLQLKCTIEGNILTIASDRGGWRFALYVRIYDPNVEEVPDFKSRIYKYHGLDNESAPGDVEEVVMGSSVKIIQSCAFQGCVYMTKCTMGDQVERIEKRAFFGCSSLRDIRLSENLECIDEWAFGRCHSIARLFLPSTLKDIKRHAFHCSNMKFLILPPHINLDRVSEDVIWGCDNLLRQYQHDLLDTTSYCKGHQDEDQGSRHHKVRQWLKNRYDHLPLLKLCMEPSATFRMIRDCIGEHGDAVAYQREKHHGMTPLHILTLHPCAHTYDTRENEAVMACFHANPGASFTPNNEGCTPLDQLW